MSYEPIDVARLWSRVQVSTSISDCWEWSGGTRKGYGVIRIEGGNASTHRMAWELFHGELLGERLACHSCGNKLCCNPYHIYAGTRKDNARDAMAMGELRPTGSVGEKNPNAKLTEKDVKSIFVLLAKGRPLKQIALKHGVTPSAISNIKRGKSWAKTIRGFEQNKNRTGPREKDWETT